MSCIRPVRTERSADSSALSLLPGTVEASTASASKTSSESDTTRRASVVMCRRRTSPIGFAAVAWPAKWNDTGVMTFIVSHDGNVYQKNLGAGTDAAARAMTRFDPDKSWTQVPDSVLVAKP